MEPVLLIKSVLWIPKLYRKNVDNSHEKMEHLIRKATLKIYQLTVALNMTKYVTIYSHASFLTKTNSNRYFDFILKNF